MGLKLSFYFEFSYYSLSPTMSDDQLPFDLFVYGTLRSGYCNHFLVNSCTFKGKAKSVEKYAFFTKEFPFVNSRIPTSHVSGEIYEISDCSVLEKLDELEEHPIVYRRSYCKVALESGEIVEVQMYFNDNYNTDDAEMVVSGDFRDSSISAKHLLMEA